MDEITTDIIVRIEVFHEDVAHTAGLLRAASDAAYSAGDSQRGLRLRVAAREVARNFRDVDVDEIDARSADLRKIRGELLK